MSDPDTVPLRTTDGVSLVAAYWPGADRRIGCVVGHGFTGSSRNPHVVRICHGFVNRGVGVLAVDFRGHGRSGGFGTAGADEIHDVAAAVAWLRGQGYEFVATLGWSMGGTAVLRHAGLGGDADAVVSVSAPGMWFERGTRPMRLVHWMFEKRTGRAATRVLRRTRVSPLGWQTMPEAPAEVAGAIAPRPLLLVHGDADRYFPRRHVDAIAAAAPSADVWVEPSMGHAEVATSARLVERIADWVLAAARPGAAACDRPSTAVCDRPSTAVCDHDGRD
ncbi:alpha/beta hydrolase family protein [uncultured Jatrophihabitans sp.]|uniref:alpha/beta hydrolase family protein n=1 Tax=uncultured Jatrophihabitans sp. TaxID=1610747 RepID=UPI0035CB235A